MEKINVGSWMLLFDSISEQNIMVKILSKNDELKIATVEMDLAVRKTDKSEKYITDVKYEDLHQPRLKPKKRAL